jgi:hypothetical protein
MAERSEAGVHGRLDCEFESGGEHGRLSFVIVVCFQV